MATVAELVADPALRLQVAAGHSGLHREVTAAAVSELVEPGPWLQGGRTSQQIVRCTIGSKRFTSSP